jgi:(S)-mandelate dehydrogenase
MARRRTPYFAFEYVEGGAEDEVALRRNRAAFEELRFAPRTLVDTSSRTTATSLFGAPLSLPLVVAPTGLNGVLRRGADRMLAHAAARAGVPFCLSTVSNLLPGDVATEGARLWMQLYVFKDLAITARVLERAEATGCEALVFTTDANVFGGREWHLRAYRGPGQLSLRSLIDVLRHPRWLMEVGIPGLPRFENVVEFLPEHARSARAGVTVIPSLFAPTISWDDVARLRDRWRRRLIIKGILRPEDAEHAVRLGCDGIVLTNHGGRQLDACVAPIEVLPEIARAVRERITILVDSGVRRGSDIAKAVALGAHAVMVGRATLYGVAAGGEAGALRAIEILRSEFDRQLGLLGCRSVAELTPDLLHR